MTTIKLIDFERILFMNPTISLDKVNVFIQQNWILRNLSFAVQPGEFLGVIGPNGAGKTTLLKVLLGLLHPQDGTITVPGRKRNKNPGSSILGYVPQSRQIDPEIPLCVWDFVSFGLPHKYRPWLTRQDRLKIQEVLQETNSEHLAYKPIGKLSGGERQRLYLAQALLCDPKVLLLDEPTSNLDPAAQENLAALVKKISNQKNLSVLFVSHDVNLISRYADRILYLTRGHYALGDVNEVMQADVLSKLYGTQISVDRI